jgi:uncharacterized protein YbaR (Trm112 family)
MFRLKCPNCKNTKNLVVLECESCGETTLKCTKCQKVYIVEEGKLIPHKEQEA